MKNLTKANFLICCLTAILLTAALGGCKEDEEEKCDCPNEATHLDSGANVDCQAGSNCPHAGKPCTLLVNELLDNGTTKIVKGVGVDKDEFDTVVEKCNNLFALLNDSMLNSFNDNVLELRVLLVGTAVSYSNKVVSFGIDKDIENDVYGYLISEGVIVTFGYESPSQKTQL